MTTTTSYSNKGRFIELYKSTFRRGIGYLGLISVLIAIFYPLQYALEAFKSIPPERTAQMSFAAGDPFYLYHFYGQGYNFTGVSAFFFTAIFLLSPFVLALVLNSYMHSKKAADVYHALPVRRETLLAVNAAVAMSYIALPLAVSDLAIAVMQTAQFGFQPAMLGGILFDLFGWLVAAFCIYTITVFVSTLAGTVFDTFVFSGALLVAPPALCGLGILLCTEFLFGFWTSDSALYTHLCNLSPVTLMPVRILNSGARAADIPGSAEAAALLNGNIAVFVWLALGAALFYGTMQLYRRRHSEMAETTTSKGILQCIIKLIGTAFCGICTALLFADSGDNPISFLLWAAIGGILAYAILETILNRGFKTLARSLPLGALMVAVTVGGTLIPITGAFGFERRVPAAADVASVEISYMGRYAEVTELRDVGPIIGVNLRGNENYAYEQRVRAVTLTTPEIIAPVLELHKGITDKKLDPRRGIGDDYSYTPISLRYTLQNGKRITRTYYGAARSDLLKLAPLETNADFLKQTHAAFNVRPEDIGEWTFASPWNIAALSLSAEESQALLTAMQTDLLNEAPEKLLHPEGLSPASGDLFPTVLTVSFTAKIPKEGGARCAVAGGFTVTDRGQETYKLLSKRAEPSVSALLSPPDFTKCRGVTLEPLFPRETTPVVQAAGFKRFTPDRFDDILTEVREFEKYRAEHPEAEPSVVSLDMYNNYEYAEYADRKVPSYIVLEGDEIPAAARQIVGSYAVGEPLLRASFYFENATGGVPVLIPLSRLPETIQARVSPFFPPRP